MKNKLSLIKLYFTSIPITICRIQEVIIHKVICLNVILISGNKDDFHKKKETKMISTKKETKMTSTKKGNKDDFHKIIFVHYRHAIKH